MTKYNPDRNYCGPNLKGWKGKLVEKMVPNVIHGVSFNQACYVHDSFYMSLDRTKYSDSLFYKLMKKEIYKAFPKGSGCRNALLRFDCLLVARIYYVLVRVGGQVID